MPEPHAPTPASGALDGHVLAGRYRLGPRIATGGMAEVRRGTDLTLGREVAVKVLHPHLAADPVTVERFRREAVAAAALNHPSIVAVYDTCSDDGVEAIVMELVRGVTLRRILDERGALDPADAVDVAAGVAEALQVAHEAGVVHRDVKPANVLLCDDRRVKVADFGIATAFADADLTGDGWVGTAKYLAPEQVRGDRVDPRADLYALGVVLYECLTGRAPFEGDTEAATALARLQRAPLRPRQIRPALPRDLDELVARTLAREPDDRPPTAAALRAELLAADLGERGAVDPTTRGLAPPLVPTDEATPSFVRTERGWLVPALLVVVVATALGVAGLLVGRTDAGRELIDRAREAVGAPADRPPTTDPAPVPVPEIAAVRAFDPQGTGPPGENDDLAPLTVDGDPTTTWRTEGYESRDFGGLPKAGVGLAIELDAPAPVERVIVESPSSGWSAGIHVAPGPTDDLAAWGDPVVVRDAIPAGRVAFELDGVEAGALLVWITDLGDGPPRVRVEVSELAVEGVPGASAAGSGGPASP